MSPIGAYVAPAIGTTRRHRTLSDTTGGPISDLLRNTIITHVTEAANNSERNLQREIGPSEIGHPCNRNIAYKLAFVAEQPDTHDPWPSIVGTAVHAWLEEKLAPRPEWLTETVVWPTPYLKGHSDAYYRPEDTVVDWKVLGNTQHAKFANKEYLEERNGIEVLKPGVYQTQIHAYGAGMMRKGYNVKRVALAIFARARTLQSLYVHSEPWDIQVAAAALVRLEKIKAYVEATGASDTNRAPILRLDPHAGHDCYFCPFKGRADEGLCGAGNTVKSNS